MTRAKWVLVAKFFATFGRFERSGVSNMSRIGNQPIDIPEKVKVAISGSRVNVEGPKGKLHLSLHDLIKVRQESGVLHLSRVTESNEAKALHGLSRSLVANMVKGVSTGFIRELDITGVGYRAEVKGHELQLALGFSHPVLFSLPHEVKATVDAKKTRITLESADKQLLGVTAAKIRSYRPPEPYRGKGVRYSDEVVKRKEGKSAGK
jgi:large subunit ribosomal protein L6